ncbi:hypothetical protein [Pseudomonas sp. LF19]|uniref:hypothetical protein n=1 Tax=Pseudomonas sp. LF19 TaxID=2899115 RepID=UPI001F224ABD|nr:hypothetical protein [Pseudomonas sp. LF19]MCE5980743.1 hypothetical protein [Pseudomonas sp. LF19]
MYNKEIFDLYVKSGDVLNVSYGTTSELWFLSCDNEHITVDATSARGEYPFNIKYSSIKSISEIDSKIKDDFGGSGMARRRSPLTTGNKHFDNALAEMSGFLENNMKVVASSIIKSKIKSQFGLDLNPLTTYLVVLTYNSFDASGKPLAEPYPGMVVSKQNLVDALIHKTKRIQDGEGFLLGYKKVGRM